MNQLILSIIALKERMTNKFNKEFRKLKFNLLLYHLALSVSKPFLPLRSVTSPTMMFRGLMRTRFVISMILPPFTVSKCKNDPMIGFNSLLDPSRDVLIFEFREEPPTLVDL